VRNILPGLLSLAVTLTPLPLLAATHKAATPKCSGRVVWVLPAQKRYVLSNNPLYGTKPGAYACESTVVARGYHMRPMQITRPMHYATPRPNPTSSPASPAVPENPALTSLARTQIDIFRTGKINRSQYGSALNGALTDKVIAQWSQLLTVLGAVTSFTYTGTPVLNGLPIAQYAVSFEHPLPAPNATSTNQWIESIATDQTGKVIYLNFVPKT